ncbi:MAG TPA: response regulator [Thermoplasmata archaeon]|nr:response regulator [Thermoplasmata archaeon]
MEDSLEEWIAASVAQIGIDLRSFLGALSPSLGTIGVSVSRIVDGPVGSIMLLLQPGAGVFSCVTRYLTPLDSRLCGKPIPFAVLADERARGILESWTCRLPASERPRSGDRSGSVMRDLLEVLSASLAESLVGSSGPDFDLGASNVSFPGSVGSALGLIHPLAGEDRVVSIEIEMTPRGLTAPAKLVVLIGRPRAGGTTDETKSIEGSSSVLVVAETGFLRRRIDASLQDAGFRDVRSVPSASQAVASCGERGADVIVLDLSAGGAGGVVTLAILRARLPHVPVVVTGGGASKRTGRRCLRLGAAGYLASAFDQRELLSEIRAARGTRFDRVLAEIAEGVRGPHVLPP